jgi:hypothetical protein
VRIEDIELYGRLSLQAVVSAVDQVEANRQVPLLRGAIDLGLNRVATAESAYYDFLAECVMLATQNMQDVRLDDVERRLLRLENPEGPGFIEILVETSVILGVELVVALGAPYLVGPALILLSARLLARSSRVPASRVTRLAARQKLLSDKVTSLKHDLTRAELELAHARRDFKTNIDTGNQTPQAAYQIIREARDSVQSTQTALELVGQELESADKVVDAFYAGLKGRAAKVRSLQLTTFLNGAAGHTLRGRIGESSGQQVARLLKEAWEQGESSRTLTESPFLGSTVVGAILSRLRELRLEAERGHGYTRLLLHRIDDAAFATDPTAQDIARGIFDAIGPLDDALALAEIARPVVVRGFEAMLWHEWLSVTGALLIEPKQTFASGFALEPGELHNGFLTQRLVRQPAITPGELGGLGILAALGALVSDAGYVYEGDLYHGVRKLSEHQAKYLYDTFAAPYFAIQENANLLPFPGEYDPSRYTAVLSAAPRTTGEVLSNFERERRLDEMRLMVVVFFNHFIPSLRAKASYGAVSDETVLIDDYLAQLPAPSPPADPAEPTPEEVTDRLDALFGQTAVGARYEKGLVFAMFDGQLTLLEQRLWMYVLVYSQTSYEAAEAPDGRTEQEALREVQDLQRLIDATYAKLLEFFETSDPDALAEFRRLYEERATTLITWHVGDPQPAKYRHP